METTVAVVEVCVKPEPMECENAEEKEQNGYKENTKESKEELWIKPEPLEDESQDSMKEEDQGTLSENEAKLDEEALLDDCSRNRQSNAPSRKQVLMFLDFLNEHRDLANCMLRGPSGRAKAHQLWEDMAERLNSISGCHKTPQQWQRVWSDKKYLARKAAAARFASMATGGPLTPDLTRQDEKILAIIGEPIPPRQKPSTPEPKPPTTKQPQDISIVSVSSKRGTAKVEAEPPPTVSEKVPLVIPTKKPYTPRKAESTKTKKSEVPKIEVPVPVAVTPQPEVLPQPEDPRPPDDPPKDKPAVQKQEDPPSSPSVSEPASPPSQLELSRQSRQRLKACLDPYTKKFIHLEEQRIKNDIKRNEELTEMRLSLQQGTVELAGIRRTMQEMLGLMKQFMERSVKK